MKLRLFAACAALLPGIVHGQPVALPVPDPASVVVPALDGRDPSVARDGWKYFYFHKAGVTYQQAYADFAECYRFLPTTEMTSGKLPMFVPWSERQGQRIIQPVNNYGLVGLAIGAMVDGPLIRRSKQSRLRRCLEPRGYVRYPLPKASWERLTNGFDQGSIATQAKAASMAQPTSQPVTE